MIRLLVVFLMAFGFFAVSAEAQRKRPAKKSTKPVITTVSATNEIRIAKEKVVNQITNVTRFIDVLSKISVGIENVDREARTKKVPAKRLADNEANKKKVIQAIQNLHAGLVALEVEFRTKASLKKYLMQIQGISNLSAQCEYTALAGRFTDSGKPLLRVIQKLSATSAVMP